MDSQVTKTEMYDNLRDARGALTQVTDAVRVAPGGLNRVNLGDLERAVADAEGFVSELRACVDTLRRERDTGWHSAGSLSHATRLLAEHNDREWARQAKEQA